MWAIGVMSGVLVGNLARRLGFGAFMLKKLLLRENLKLRIVILHTYLPALFFWKMVMKENVGKY